MRGRKPPVVGDVAGSPGGRLRRSTERSAISGAVLQLGLNESAEGRPFTAADLLDRDFDVLDMLLGHVVDALGDTDRGLAAHEERSWEDDGRSRRLIVCNADRLRGHPNPCVVGFFGQRTSDAGIGPLDEANAQMVAEFEAYPGILSYGSHELESGEWANLVLHDDPVDREYWNRGERHARAVRELAPIHYRTVRIHNARLTAPVLDEPSIHPIATKFWDYTAAGVVWRAERRFGEEWSTHDGPPGGE